MDKKKLEKIRKIRNILESFGYEFIKCAANGLQAKEEINYAKTIEKIIKLK